MPSYVIEYHRKGRALNVSEFESSKDAMGRRFELERDRADTGTEVVVIRASSLDVVRRTHSRYF